MSRSRAGEFTREDPAVLLLEQLLPRLRGLPWGRLGAKWVVLFGSLARRGRGRDVDLLVAPRDVGGAEWRLRLALGVADALGLDWGLVDVVEAGPGTLCAVVRDAWRHGLVVYEERRGEAREWLLTRVEVCVDNVLAAERLGVYEVASRAAKRRWGR